MATTKMNTVIKQAERKFGRPGAPRGVAGKGEVIPTITLNTKDPRFLDYVYEVTFSSSEAPPSQGFGGKEPTLEAVRDIIFTLPEFKVAVDRVAYSEDLQTKRDTIEEGLARCRLCGSNNTTSTMRQLHSSDEPPTMILFCASCHHRTTQTGE